LLSWEELERECLSCKKCELSSSRTNVVIGRGNIHADILFVGEGPGEQEDLQGLPFVGPAGKTLDLVLNACMISADDYYIANIVKCRPPNNRDPLESEALACLPYLRAQFSLIKPKIIVCLGRISASYLISRDIQISRDRGQWFNKKGYYFIPTFHPAALLRDSSKKMAFWEDIMKVKELLDELRNRAI